MRSILTTAVVIAFSLAAGAAWADAKADAKKHFDAGLSLMQSEDYNGAAVEFEESGRLYKTKSAIFNLANCYKALKRYDESLASLKLLEGEFGESIDAEMKAAIAAMRKEIQSITGTLVVQVYEDGASIFVDGARVGRSPIPSPLLLGPGYHEVRVELGSKAPIVKKVKLVSGESREVSFSFGDAEQGPPKPAAEVESAETEPKTETAPTETAPTETGQSGRRRSPALLASSIAATAVTVGLGVVAGVFWGRTSSACDDYNNLMGAYTESENDQADEERIYGELVDARNTAAKNNGVAVGLTIGAGVAAAASAVLWVLYARSGRETQEPAPVSFESAPGGVSVEF
jgi:hypothetical protein